MVIWDGLNSGDQVTGEGEVTLEVDALAGQEFLFQVSSDTELDIDVSWNRSSEIQTDPAEFPRNLGLVAKVYESDASTLVTEVPRRLATRFQEALNTPSPGELQIPLSDPILQAYPKLFKFGRIVKFFLNGKCVSAFRIKQRRTTWVSNSEYSGMIRTVSGPTVHYILDDFMVRHDGPYRPDSSDTRYYSWASRPDEWYNASDWDHPVEVWTLDNPPSAKKENQPQHWRVPSARWITARGKWKYFRRNVTINGHKVVRIFATADEWFRLYVDGEEVLYAENVEFGYRTFVHQDIILGPGSHTFAAQVRAIDSPKGDGVDNFLFAMCELNDDQKPKLPPILVSNGNWVAHVGNPPPGWNRAQVLRNCVKEARARGNETAQALTFRFTANTDSHGKPWRDTFNQDVRIGTSALDLQAVLSEGGGFDVWVDPDDLSLYAWKHRGRNKASSIALRPGVNLIDWETVVDEDIRNTFLIQYDGGFATTRNAHSQRVNGRREGYVVLGNVKNDDSAVRIVKRAMTSVSIAEKRASTSDIRVKPEEAPEGGLIAVPGAIPFVDFHVGDTISAPNEDGDLVPHRVLSLTCVEDQFGRLSFDPELEVVE